MSDTSKPKCQLIGTDGNAFALVGKACEALERAGQRDKAKELRGKLFSFKSYDEVLVGIMEYVEVTEPENEDDGEDRWNFLDMDAEDEDDDDPYAEPCLDCGAESGESCKPDCPSEL